MPLNIEKHAPVSILVFEKEIPMKRTAAFIYLSLLFFLTHAQDSKAVFTGEKIVWFGLDFTKARLIGVNDEKPDVIVNEYLELWNMPMLYEADKFPIASTFRKVTVQYDAEVVKARNKKVTKQSLFNDNEAIITTAAIEQMISEYTGSKKTGLGVVFFVESFNKKKKLATMHVTFFDIATRKVLLTRRLTGEPGGGGLKYYWANSVSRIFHDITVTHYDLWEKEAKK